MNNLQLVSIIAGMMAAAHYIRNGSDDIFGLVWLVLAAIYCTWSELRQKRIAPIAGQRGGQT